MVKPVMEKPASLKSEQYMDVIEAPQAPEKTCQYKSDAPET